MTKLKAQLKARLDSEAVDERSYTSYLLTWWWLVLLNLMLIKLPMVVAGQGVNFYHIALDTKVDHQAFVQAGLTTLLMYPLTMAFVLAGLVLNLYDVANNKRHTVIMIDILVVIGLLNVVNEYSVWYTLPNFLLVVGLVITDRWQFSRRLGLKLRDWWQNRWPWKTKLNRWWPVTMYAAGLLVLNWALFGNNLQFGAKQIVTDLMPVLNVLALLAAYAVFKGITGRYWGTILWLTLGYDFFYLFSIMMRIERQDAIVPGDLSMLKAISSLSKMVSPLILVAIIITGLGVTWLGMILRNVYPVSHGCWQTRSLMVLAGLVFYLTPFYWNHYNSWANKVFVQHEPGGMFYNQAYGAQLNGPWWQFLNNVDIQVMNQPRGYSNATMMKVAKEAQRDAREINRSRHQELNQFTVIDNLSESFADPKRVPGVTYQGEAIPFIKQLKKSDPSSGLMMSSGYGGGTANMEYMTLTSLPLSGFAKTMAMPFTQLVPFNGNHQESVARRWSTSSTIHPFVNAFYDRSVDYPKLGIQTFYNLSDDKHPIKHQHQIENDQYMSDQTAYMNVFDQLHRVNGPQFINLVTMQNHMPYDNKYQNTDQWQANVGEATTDSNLLEQYLTGIHFTDRVVRQFKQRLDTVNRPIAWVFYGDHLPGFYTNNMGRDGVKMHQTDYFIYLNPAARAKVGSNVDVIKAPVTDPTNFTALLLSNLNAKVTPFEAVQTQVLTQLPAKSLNTQGQPGGQWFNRQTGKVVKYKQLSKSQKRLWHEYRLIQYDQTAGQQYLEHTHFYRR